MTAGSLADSRAAGYSGTPLPRKLGIKEGMSVLLLGAPKERPRTLGPLPQGARLRYRVGARVDLALWFVKAKKELERDMVRRAPLAKPGGLWIAWPKKGSRLAGDVSEADVRRAGLAAGLVDYKICAIDETWSGLKVARRKQ